MVKDSFHEAGVPAVGFDKVNNFEWQNFNSPKGFVTSLQWLSQLAPGSLCHWATECSTFVFLSRASTGRTSFNPSGWKTDAVMSGNRQVARMSALILLLISICCIWLLEQPSTSIMCQLPKMRRLYQLTGYWRVHT